MAAAFPFVAPAQGPGVLQPFPNPNLYLGVYSFSNPSASINGQWWFRMDENAIYEYVNGQAVKVEYLGPTTVVYGSQTLGGANVIVDNDIIVLPSGTLVTYGSILFLGDLRVLPGGVWLSANPNASSTSSATNSYTFYKGAIYLDGSYTTAPYNLDVLNAPGGNLYVYTVMSPSATISANVYLNVDLYSYNNTVVLYNASVTGCGACGLWTPNASSTFVVSGSTTIANLSGFQGGGYVVIEGTMYVPAGAVVGSGIANPSASPSATIIVDGALLLANAWSPTYSGSDAYSYTNPPVLGSAPTITGSGIAVFGSTLDAIQDSPNTAVVTSITIASNSTYSSVSVAGKGVGGGLGFAPTFIQASASGWSYLELYGSNGFYYNIAAIYSGSAGASATPLAPWPLRSCGICNTPSGYYTYVRNGANSAGAIVVSGTIYGG